MRSFSLAERFEDMRKTYFYYETKKLALGTTIQLSELHFLTKGDEFFILEGKKVHFEKC